jgi:hypothetical protein
MGTIEMKSKEISMLNDCEIEARWRGELNPAERNTIKAWAKKASIWGTCELRIGKDRSRMVITFDKSKIEQHSRAQMGWVEGLLRVEELAASAPEGSAEALALLRNASLGSTQGLLVKDYADVIARDWLHQTKSSLQALFPARCQLRVSTTEPQTAESPLGV